MTLCSCSTLLCLRLCSSAVGANSGWLVRNTAVPGTDVRRMLLEARQQSIERHFGAPGFLSKNVGAPPPGQE